MKHNSENVDNDRERRPEGKEGAGAHQEGKHAEQAGQTNRRAPGDNQKNERARRLKGDSENQNAKRFSRPGSQPEQGNKGKAK